MGSVFEVRVWVPGGVPPFFSLGIVVGGCCQGGVLTGFPPSLPIVMFLRIPLEGRTLRAM